MSSLLDLPTAQEPSPFLNSIPADSRNFGRPKESDRISTIPMDENSADDNNRVKEFEKVFGLPLTGKPSPTLIALITGFENLISNKLGISAKGKIWDPASQTIKTNLADVQAALDLLKNIK